MELFCITLLFASTQRLRLLLGTAFTSEGHVRRSADSVAEKSRISKTCALHTLVKWYPGLDIQATAGKPNVLREGEYALVVHSLYLLFESWNQIIGTLNGVFLCGSFSWMPSQPHPIKHSSLLLRRSGSGLAFLTWTDCREAIIAPLSTVQARTV